MAEMAPNHASSITFVSFPGLPFPLPVLFGRRILERVRALQPDVVVLDSIAAAFVAPWLRLNQLPLASILHQPPGGVDHGRVRWFIQEKLDRRAYRQAARLLVASDSLADELAREGMDRKWLTVIPPGRNVSSVEVEPPIDLRKGRSAAFLCVANWLPNKGIHQLLEAFALLPDDAGTLHLVGDDRADLSYAAKICRRLTQPDLNQRVVAHGPVSRQEISVLYRSADVFVLTSATETYATSAGEAMAEGLPVIAYAVGNLPHLLDDDREGFLIPPGDVAAFSAAMQRLATDENLRKRMGDSGKERAMKRPSWEETASAFFGALREVAREGSSALEP
jgi:glycosyltransferase involved in cell wall biosynthesis